MQYCIFTLNFGRVKMPLLEDEAFLNVYNSYLFHKALYATFVLHLNTKKVHLRRPVMHRSSINAFTRKLQLQLF